MAGHIFTIDEIVAFVGEPNGITDLGVARSLAIEIRRVLDEHLRLDCPYVEIPQEEWWGLIENNEGWLVSEAVKALIQSISRFELLVRIASTS